MKMLALLSVAALLYAPSLFAAETKIVIGQPCTQLGTSTMTSDQKNIGVCLKNDAGALVWKASTSAAAAPSGTLCGLAGVNLSGASVKGAYNYSSGIMIYMVSPCNGTNILDMNATPHCPTGYTPKSINVICNTGASSETDPGCAIWTCAAN